VNEYPWYEIVKKNDPIKQGDLVNSCPTINPVSDLDIGEGKKLSANVDEYDVVVMSQSCDLEHEKIDLVLVCPFITLTDFGELNSFYKSEKAKEAIRRGYFPGYHLLNKCEIEGHEKDYLIVDFRNVHGVPIDLLKNVIGGVEERIRLLPPYREHLSQAFARFFMRVGLPSDIPEFTNKVWR
jgi:hypothetical protein